jgi:ATP-dependent Lhr-like helicase
MRDQVLIQGNTKTLQEDPLMQKSDDAQSQLIIDKYKKEGFDSLTAIQQKALPVILRKIHSLIVAPTGSGKTEAAIIPIFARLSRDLPKNSGKIKVLYLTPLRALNNDVFRRIVKYARSESLSVEIRHGDTTNKAKKKIMENPPDVLITTPESLAVVLTNERMLEALGSLEWVIVDEVHELVSNERGTHLSISMERLQAASSHEFTRIGLSATVGNLDQAARFIAGYNRRYAIIVDNYRRSYNIDLNFVEGSLNHVALSVIEYIKLNSISGPVLLFSNTRDEAEYLATILKNQQSIKVDIHHGSLSRDIREEAEDKLKTGSAGIVVCTSSLELGLDIGSVDLVIHYGSPRQVSKLVQRIGRSRHANRSSAKGLIVANKPDDELESLAILRRMKKGSIEEQIMHKDALDVLSHHAAGLALQSRNPIIIGDFYGLITNAHPFAQIPRCDVQDCIDLLHTNGIIRYNRENESYTRTFKTYKYYFDNLSTIPHVLKFEVIDSVNRRRIGTLDQRFVGDYGEKGNVFVLRGLQWRVLSVDEKRMLVNVEPLHGATINIPYWIGEMIPVDYKTAEQVGLLRTQAARNEIHLSTPVIKNTLNSLKIIPDSKNIVIESSIARNMTVLHGTFGSKVNNTLATLMSTILSSQLGYIVETRSDPYRIMLTSNARLAKGHFEAVLGDSYDLESVIIASFGGTHAANWRVWMVGKRFGVIGKQALYDKKVARMIYDRYAKTPLSKEAIRELIHDKYDVIQTAKLLNDYKNGIIKIHWKEMNEFSDLARPIVEQSAKFSASPLSIEKGIIELVKQRIEKTKHKLICIRCGKWQRVIETKEIPTKIQCLLCRSRLVTSTFWSDNELADIIVRRLTGVKLSPVETHRFDRAWKVASLINNFGQRAIVVLGGYGIGADTAARILRDQVDDADIYNNIYKAERQYVTTRSFWND